MSVHDVIYFLYLNTILLEFEQYKVLNIVHVSSCSTELKQNNISKMLAMDTN